MDSGTPCKLHDVIFSLDALDAVLEGRTPDTQATTSPGCELSYEAVDAARNSHHLP